MNILIFGASGGRGHELIMHQSLQKGHRVTAFVRNASRLNIRDNRLTVIATSNTIKMCTTSCNPGKRFLLRLDLTPPFEETAPWWRGVRHRVAGVCRAASQVGECRFEKTPDIQTGRRGLYALEPCNTLL